MWVRQSVSQAVGRSVSGTVINGIEDKLVRQSVALFVPC